MRRRKRTKKKRNGIRLITALLLVACGIAGAADHRKSATYALVSGTVFRDPGFAFPGVSVVLTLAPADTQPHKKFKPLKTTSDGRGEFAFRLPPVAGHYVVEASAKGFLPQEKKAEVSDPQEDVNLNFLLMPKSKQEVR